MSFNMNYRQISKEDYEAIKAGAKNVADFFNIAETAGYGALPYPPEQRDGKYVIPYYMSDSCD